MKRQTFVTTLLITSALTISANESTYHFHFNKSARELQCLHTTITSEGDHIKTTTPDICLKNLDQLKSKLRFILAENDQCYAFTDGHPSYFAGITSDQANCNNNKKEELDTTPNVLKYVDHQVSSLCQELGTCLFALSKQSQTIVDNTLEIMKRIKIKSALDQMKAQTGKEEFYEDLPDFLHQLDTLEEQAYRCQQNLSYGGEEEELHARDALSKDLSSISNVLKDDKYVFHWYDAAMNSAATSQNGDSNIIARTYASMLQDNYFSSDHAGGTGMQGRGFYGSPGPKSTNNFGSILLKIRLPKGSKYLEMGAMNIPVSKETLSALKTVGCDIKKDADYLMQIIDRKHYVNKAAFSAIEECREVFNDVIKKENYIFHSYLYNRGINSACDYEFNQAVVLIQNEMTKENVRAYDNPFRQKESEMSEEVRDLADLAEDRSRLSPERIKELSDKYQDHLWQCK